MYFCATCECACICAECVVQKEGRHREHEVMKATRACEALRSRLTVLLDDAVSLEDDLSLVSDRLAWRRKDIERAAARGRASVRSAFARVRAQLADRESELLESLDTYESSSLSRLEQGTTEQSSYLTELRHLQDRLRSRCRSGDDAVEALNAYVQAKAAVASIRDMLHQEDLVAAPAPEEFVGLAGSARAELDLHAAGLASLEEAVASLYERGVETYSTASHPTRVPPRGGGRRCDLEARLQAAPVVRGAGCGPRGTSVDRTAPAHRSRPLTNDAEIA